MNLTGFSSSYTSEQNEQIYINAILQSFQEKSRLKLSENDYEIKERSDGNFLLIYLCNPTERFFKMLNETLESLPEDNIYKERTTLKKTSTK